MKEKKKFSIFKFLWILPLIMAIFFGLYGIVNLFSFNLFLGPSLIFICFLFIFITIISLNVSYPDIFSSKSKTSANKNTENSVSQKPIEPAKTDESTKLKECIYCGSLAKADSVECDSCGGKKFKKVKH